MPQNIEMWRAASPFIGNSWNYHIHLVRCATRQLDRRRGTPRLYNMSATLAASQRGIWVKQEVYAFL
jgi:hypothetical protein